VTTPATDIDLLKRLTEAHGTSGSEGAVRAIVAAEIGGDLRCDRTGNLIAERPGTADDLRLMITGHMDEVGFAVQSITGDGYIKFVPMGGWWGHTLLAQRVHILTRAGHEVLGVITSTPPHFLSEDARNRVMKVDEMYMDIGASSREMAMDDFGVRLGDPIVPDSLLTPMHRPNLLLAKAFDNRCGVGATIQAAQNLADGKHPNTLLAVATVQEEVGCRGILTACHAANPNIALVMEGTPADDRTGSNPADCQGRLGGGAQIRLQDPSAIMNRGLAEYVISIAEVCNIPHQVAVRTSGGTDAKNAHLHGIGVPTVVIGTPARYIHTHNSIIDIDDYRAVVQLATEVARRLDASTAATFTTYL